MKLAERAAREAIYALADITSAKTAREARSIARGSLLRVELMVRSSMAVADRSLAKRIRARRGR